MPYVKNILFIAVCIALGLGVGKLFIYLKTGGHSFEHNDRPPRITGVGDAPNARGFVLRQLDAAALPTLFTTWRDHHATTLGIEYAANLTKESLTAATKAAHDHRLSVVLLPAKASSHNPYPRPLAEIAADARVAGVDFLCIGWLDADPDAVYWREQAALVRSNFGGKVILAANFPVVLRVNCWDISDLIGVMGPIPFAQRLPGAPDDIEDGDLRTAWACTLGGLESYADAHSKKLAFLRANVPLAVSLKLASPDAQESIPPLNPGLQQKLYEALFLETKARDSRHEVLLFDWGGAGDRNALNSVPNLMSKLAEAWITPPPATSTAPATAAAPTGN